MATLYKARKSDTGLDSMEEQVEVFPASGKAFTLEELQGFVEGNGSKTIQYLPLPDGRVMFANDNGKLVGLPLNVEASAFWREMFPLDKYPFNNDGMIVGNAIVCTKVEAGDEDDESGAGDNGDES